MDEFALNDISFLAMERREFFIRAAGIAAFALIGGLPSCTAAGTVPPEKAADAIVYATIYRTSNRASGVKAMAIKDGAIVFVGGRDEAAAYIGEATEIIDYSERFIFPGFIDGHAYVSTWAECAGGDIFLAGCSSPDELVQAIRSFARQNPDAAFIRGSGWREGQFGEGVPLGAILDEACPNIPIYLLSADCRSAWVNAAMMNRCGVTAEAEDPIGGVIERLEGGKPSGCFRDSAKEQLIDPFVPSLPPDKLKAQLLSVQERYAALGYTACNDVVSGLSKAENVCCAYSELAAEGNLPLKVDCTVIVGNDDGYVAAIQGVKALADRLNGNAFRVSGIEFVMDGPAELGEAYLLEPYEGTESHGVDRWPGEAGAQRLAEAARLCNDLGLAALFRADGDAAVRKALDAIEYARKSSTNKQARNGIVHAGLVSDEDIRRFADLDIAVVCVPGRIPFSGDMPGGERAASMYRCKSLKNAGAAICYGTDYPANPDCRPLYGLQVMASRQYLGIESTLRNADEVITVEDALAATTANAAHRLAREDQIGTLAVGKRADFVVLDRDILACPAEDIYKAEVVAAYGNGRAIFDVMADV